MTGADMRFLMGVAAGMGLRVHGAYLPSGEFGYYSPDEDRIYFDLTLTPFERRCTVAHELGHAYYGHRSDSEQNERIADSYAAELLIDPVEYAAAEQISDDIEFLADELCVVPTLIEHFRLHCLQRLGQRTYSTRPQGRFSNALARRIS